MHIQFGNAPSHAVQFGVGGKSKQVKADQKAKKNDATGRNSSNTKQQPAQPKTSFASNNWIA